MLTGWSILSDSAVVSVDLGEDLGTFGDILRRAFVRWTGKSPASTAGPSIEARGQVTSLGSLSASDSWRVQGR